MNLSELATRLGGELHGPDAAFDGFTLDSRADQEGKVFLAIKGANVDGHEFVPWVVGSGAVAAVVESPQSVPHILVPSLVEALAAFGKSIRREFSGPVVGITGSNGKTSSKEMVSAALGHVLKTEGNQNTEFTSPLLWFGLRSDHTAAVVEMGMRGFGQIRHLASVAEPTHGLITMIGTSHIEMVGSREGIVRAKGELFESLPSNGVAFYWAEDDYAGDLSKIPSCPTRTFGCSPDADCRVVGYRPIDLYSSEVMVALDGETCTFRLPTIGRHQALNAAAAVLVGGTLGRSLASIAEGLEKVQLPPMRMEIREFRNARILMDSYNASPDSMVAALRTLSELPADGRKLAVIGEMKELGEFTESGHRRLGRELAATPIDQVVLYGESTAFVRAEALQNGFPEGKIFDAHSIDEVAGFMQGVQAGDLILIKGSRALGLERALEQEG